MALRQPPVAQEPGAGGRGVPRLRQRGSRDRGPSRARRDSDADCSPARSPLHRDLRGGDGSAVGRAPSDPPGSLGRRAVRGGGSSPESGKRRLAGRPAAPRRGPPQQRSRLEPVPEVLRADLLDLRTGRRRTSRALRGGRHPRPSRHVLARPRGPRPALRTHCDGARGLRGVAARLLPVGLDRLAAAASRPGRGGGGARSSPDGQGPVRGPGGRLRRTLPSHSPRGVGDRRGLRGVRADLALPAPGRTPRDRRGDRGPDRLSALCPCVSPVSRAPGRPGAGRVVVRFHERRRGARRKRSLGSTPPASVQRDRVHGTLSLDARPESPPRGSGSPALRRRPWSRRPHRARARPFAAPAPDTRGTGSFFSSRERACSPGFSATPEALPTDSASIRSWARRCSGLRPPSTGGSRMPPGPSESVAHSSRASASPRSSRSKRFPS